MFKKMIENFQNRRWILLIVLIVFAFGILFGFPLTKKLKVFIIRSHPVVLSDSNHSFFVLGGDGGAKEESLKIKRVDVDTGGVVSIGSYQHPRLSRNGIITDDFLVIFGGIGHNEPGYGLKSYASGIAETFDLKNQARNSIYLGSFRTSVLYELLSNNRILLVEGGITGLNKRSQFYSNSFKNIAGDNKKLQEKIFDSLIQSKILERHEKVDTRVKRKVRSDYINTNARELKAVLGADFNAAAEDIAETLNEGGDYESAFKVLDRKFGKKAGATYRELIDKGIFQQKEKKVKLVFGLVNPEYSDLKESQISQLLAKELKPYARIITYTLKQGINDGFGNYEILDLKKNISEGLEKIVLTGVPKEIQIKQSPNRNIFKRQIELNNNKLYAAEAYNKKNQKECLALFYFDQKNSKFHYKRAIYMNRFQSLFQEKYAVSVDYKKVSYGVYESNLSVFDLDSGKLVWEKKLKYPRKRPKVVTYQDKVVVIGGMMKQRGIKKYFMKNSAEIITPFKKKHKLVKLKETRKAYGHIILQNKLYLVGGVNDDGFVQDIEVIKLK